MLTATPVNNSLWDLYYLLNYFIKNDATFATQGFARFAGDSSRTQATDPSELSPDMLFDVLDETTVRRTRRFIRTATRTLRCRTARVARFELTSRLTPAPGRLHFY